MVGRRNEYDSTSHITDRVPSAVRYPPCRRSLVYKRQPPLGRAED